MQVKNRNLPLLAGIVLAGVLAFSVLPKQAQEQTPDSARIEQVAMLARQTNDAKLERRLQVWARQDLPVAQRELGLLYLTQPAHRSDALSLFETAARGGDAEAAFALGEMLRSGAVGIAPAPAKAWPWLVVAAERRHARAALVLGMLSTNGDDVPRDEREGARWLAVSSELGDAHATFLLANAYRAGRGVAIDPVKSRALLEAAAKEEYPPAVQELAMALQIGDLLSPRDDLRAAHLLQEASEHRHNSWNHF
jgi:hypothetical protein